MMNEQREQSGLSTADVASADEERWAYEEMAIRVRSPWLSVVR